MIKTSNMMPIGLKRKTMDYQASIGTKAGMLFTTLGFIAMKWTGKDWATFFTILAAISTVLLNIYRYSKEREGRNVGKNK